MKKSIFLIGGLIIINHLFGATLTNEKYVSNTVDTVVMREVVNMQTTIIETVKTDTAVTNTAAVEVAQAYTDAKDAAVNARVDAVTNDLSALTTTVVDNKASLEIAVGAVASHAHTELTNEVAQLNAKIGACTASDPAAAKSYVDDLVASVPKFRIVVVDAVPNAVDADPSTVYLVRNAEESGDQLYAEWIKVTKDGVSTMEKLGEAAIKLAGYAKETYVTNKVEEAVAPVRSDLATLTGTVTDNKTNADTGIAANAANIATVSNLVVATESNVKQYADDKIAEAATESAKGIATNKADIAALATKVSNDKANFEAELAATNAVFAAALADAASSGAQGVASAAEAKAFAVGVSNTVEALSATVANNKTATDAAVAAAEGKITVVSNLVVSSGSDMKTYVDGQDTVVSNAAVAYTDTKFGALSGTVSDNKFDIEGKLETAKTELTTAFGNADAAVSNNVIAIAAADATSKANAAKSYADTAALTAKNGAILTSTNFTKTAIADLATKESVTSVSNIAELAKSTAATAGSKADAAQGTADSAEAAAAAADAKAVAAQTTANVATNKLKNITGSVDDFVTGLVNSSMETTLTAATQTAAAHTDNATNTVMTKVSTVEAQVATINTTTIPQAKLEAKTNAVNECRYTVKTPTGKLETVGADTYTVYDLEDRTHFDLEPVSNYIAFRFPAAIDGTRHDRACIVLLKTPAGNAPSISLLLASGDTTTKVFYGDTVYVPLSSFEAGKTYLIYFNELGVNKWWYQDCELTQELGN